LTGIMMAGVELFRRSPQPGAVIPAQATPVCNSGAIPSSIREDEGFQLAVGMSPSWPLVRTIGMSGFDDQSLREVE
jgi:hypothetical protein